MEPRPPPRPPPRPAPGGAAASSASGAEDYMPAVPRAKRARASDYAAYWRRNLEDSDWGLRYWRYHVQRLVPQLDPEDTWETFTTSYATYNGQR
eukprot:3621375-Pyramimonas_sp.AAC.1